MPSNTTFDPFRRFRLRSTPAPTLPSSSEEDSDESSPERDRPHIIHIAPGKNDRKSGEPFVSISESGKTSRGAPEKFTENTHMTFSFDKASHTTHPERPSKKSLKFGLARWVWSLGSPAIFLPHVNFVMPLCITVSNPLLTPPISNSRCRF